MTVQQLKYILKVAEVGSITEAAKLLLISQPSLSNSIKETEKETGITIFLRSRTGITLTKEGTEFLGYARQVIQQMELLEDRYVTNLPGKVTFGVSSQHYTFTENAFVELVKRFGQERYAFYYNETGTHQILDDVKNRVCDLGILYLSHENEVVMRKVIEENHLVFTELFSAKPHVFLQKDHPLASKKVVSIHDLAPYPRLNFVQGAYESVYFSEELFSSIPVDKEIRVNDRGAIVNFMLGLNAYTISSGIFPKYLNGENIISVPLAENETMHAPVPYSPDFVWGKEIVKRLQNEGLTISSYNISLEYGTRVATLYKPYRDEFIVDKGKNITDVVQDIQVVKIPNDRETLTAIGWLAKEPLI